LEAYVRSAGTGSQMRMKPASRRISETYDQREHSVPHLVDLDGSVTICYDCSHSICHTLGEAEDNGADLFLDMQDKHSQ
jgi:hypothetical protein